jgi:hypothetical protein
VKTLLIISACLAMLACAEKRRVSSAEVAVIEYPLDCLTGPVILEQCDKWMRNCKRVRFDHKSGCEQVKVK